jgi:hypothetical protein
MIQYINWKQVKVTGKKIRLYLSMSDAVIPNNLFRFFASQSGLAGAGGGGGGKGIGIGGGAFGDIGGGGASISYLIRWPIWIPGVNVIKKFVCRCRQGKNKLECFSSNFFPGHFITSDQSHKGSPLL